MQQNTGNIMARVEFQQCVQDLQTCHDMCMQMVEDERHASGEHGQSGHTSMLRDCARLCQVTAHFLQDNNPLYGYVTSACAQVTQHCSEECQRMGDTDCANACQNAAWSLQQISKLVQY
ncbi:MAG TPA: hypothetical protein VFA09_10475 [Ktedonobacteraceae bacterium]|nr:hypothetical protein [Ktedonobacteraceae bacterium]